MSAKEEPRSDPFAPRHTLSPTDRKLLDLVVRGLTSQQIADEMKFARSTVERYLQNLRLKMSAKNNAQLVANALTPKRKQTEVNGVSSPTYPKLSASERAILELLARGWTAREIGDHMNLNFRTIERHIEALRLKMNARNVAHLVANAFAKGALKVVRGNVKLGA